MARRNHLILHIGHYKTGTTALQDDLAGARDQLAAERILYPAAGAPAAEHHNHSAVAFQMMARAEMHVPKWYERTEGFARFADGKESFAGDQLAREVRSSRAEVVVVSSEEFIRFGFGKVVPPTNTRDFVASLRPERVTVVCYLRRPDRYLDSWYNQLVKLSTAQPRLATSIRRFFGTAHTAYDKGLQYWRDEVGCDELVVRDYDHLVGGSIRDDFADATGIEIPASEQAEPTFSNPRIDNNFIEYARVRAVFRPNQPAQDFHKILASLQGNPRLPPLKQVDVLGGRARRELYEYFVPVNERLGELTGCGEPFFSDLDEMLEVPEGSITDEEAFRYWAPYIDIALRSAGID